MIIKTDFAKGNLNRHWRTILFAKRCFPEDSKWVAEIDALESALMRYALVTPWPLNDGEEPDSFRLTFTTRDHENFWYYLGVGFGMAVALDFTDAELPDSDIEERILASCLRRYAAHESEKLARLTSGKQKLVDFLAAHVGDNPTRNDMKDATGLQLETIRAFIDSLKDKDLIRFGFHRVIEDFDADAAQKLIEDEEGSAVVSLD